MKKNITINLCGRLFAIDEDAYEMLATYEQSLRNYFRSREGGEEIAEDIEARIAELLDELKAQGVEAVTIEHVTEIIHRIGKPEEMEEVAPHSAPEGATDASSSASNGTEASSGTVGGTSKATKRLYRNPSDRKVLGVLSGLAAYFGGDVLWWRLGYVGLLMLIWMMPWVMPLSIIRFVFVRNSFVYEDGAILNSLLLVFCYIVFAVLMPVAETPEDRLRMKGKEVNPQNLAEEISSSHSPSPRSTRGGEDPLSSETTSCNPTPTSGDEPLPRTGGVGSGAWGKGHRGPSGCISGTIGCIGGFFIALWTVITTLFRWCIYAFGAFLAVMCLIGIFMLFVVAFNPVDKVFSSSWISSPEFAEILPTLKVPFVIFLISSIVVLSITAYAIIHSLLNEFRQMSSMPYRQRIALLVMWIMGILVAGAALGSRWFTMIDAANKYNKRVWNEYDERSRIENTHDGIYYQPHEWEFLSQQGWRVVRAEGCNDRYTAHGEYYGEDRWTRYIDTYGGKQLFTIEHTDTLQPGTYRLTACVRADGQGACLYAIIDDYDNAAYLCEIPANGNEGGDVWREAVMQKAAAEKAAEERGGAMAGPIYERMCALAAANDGRGYGWNRDTLPEIRISKRPARLRYGVTTNPAITHQTWLGKWFSATDFELIRVE